MKPLLAIIILTLITSYSVEGQVFDSSHLGNSVEISGKMPFQLTSTNLVGFIPREQIDGLLSKPDAVGLRLYNIPKNNEMILIATAVKADGWDVENSYWNCSVSDNKLIIQKLGGRLGAESLVSNTPNISSKFTSYYSKAMIENLLPEDSQHNGIKLYLVPTGKGLQKTHFASAGSMDENKEIQAQGSEVGIASDLPCPSHCLSTVRNSEGEIIEVKISSFAADPMPMSSFAGPYIRFWH